MASSRSGLTRAGGRDGSEGMADGFAPRFELDPGIDPEKLAAAYAAKGRIRIEPFLSADSSALLRDHLQERTGWRLALKGETHQVFEFDEAARAAMSAEQGRAL